MTRGARHDTIPLRHAKSLQPMRSRSFSVSRNGRHPRRWMLCACTKSPPTKPFIEPSNGNEDADRFTPQRGDSTVPLARAKYHFAAAPTKRIYKWLPRTKKRKGREIQFGWRNIRAFMRGQSLLRELSTQPSAQTSPIE